MKFFSNKKLLIAISIIPQLILFNSGILSPKFIESSYSTGFYPYISRLLRWLFHWSDKSIGEKIALYVPFIIAGLCIYKFVKQLKSKDRNVKQYLLKLLLNLGVGLSTLYMIFMLVWGFNYHRVSIDQQFGLRKAPRPTSELIVLCDTLIERCNTLREQVNPYEPGYEFDYGQVATEILALYQQFDSTRYSNLGSPKCVKEVHHPYVMATLSIGGIYFPFTGEANVNQAAPTHELPFTMAHEIGHQAGYAREDEANFIAFLVCRNSQNPLIQYSAYRAAVKYSMGMLIEYDEDAFHYLREKYSSKLNDDVYRSLGYWQQYDGPMADYSSDINDLYLKVNSQDEGVDSYGLIVDLLLAERERPITNTSPK